MGRGEERRREKKNENIKTNKMLRRRYTRIYMHTNTSAAISRLTHSTQFIHMFENVGVFVWRQLHHNIVTKMQLLEFDPDW